MLLSVFGGVALVLATIGIYGVVSYSAQQRARELAIRAAFGAEPRHLKSVVLRQGAVLIAGGVGIGLVAAFYLSKWLAAVLFAVDPRDGSVFTAVPALLATVALTAVWLVARRASRADALATLRSD